MNPRSENVDYTEPNKLVVIAILLIVTAAIIGLIGLWWWALFGMTQPVGIAVSSTAGGIFVGGIVCSIASI